VAYKDLIYYLQYMTHHILYLGLVIRTRCPSPREMRAFAAPDLASFINRKGFYGIVVLAACRANLEFVLFSAKHTGSTNDVVAIAGCEGGRILLGKSAIELPKGYYGIGDEAFICSDTLLTPWSGRGLEQNKDSFNFLLSAMRQCIERAFGVFVGRWGLFRRPLVVGAAKWGLVTGVCAKLHNYCIRQGESAPAPPLSSDMQIGDDEVILDNTMSASTVFNNRSGKAGSSLRRNLTTAIGEWGQMRPDSNYRRNNH
jgi:hypothetical protein